MRMNIIRKKPFTQDFAVGTRTHRESSLLLARASKLFLAHNEDTSVLAGTTPFMDVGETGVAKRLLVKHLREFAPSSRAKETSSHPNIELDAYSDVQRHI